MRQEKFFEPAISSLLGNRKLAAVLLGAALLQLGLFAAKLPGWQCPFFHILGIPCPGCGLTRATSLLFHGNLRASVTLHAFAPFFLLVLLLVSSAALLPEQMRQPMIRNLEEFERRTGITVIFLGALILYWLARLLFLQSAFVQLIRG